MARESQARMSTAYGYPYDDPTSTFQCRGAGAKQYARIQGHLYEHAAAADAVRCWVLAQQSTPYSLAPRSASSKRLRASSKIPQLPEFHVTVSLHALIFQPSGVRTKRFV